MNHLKLLLQCLTLALLAVLPAKGLAQEEATAEDIRLQKLLKNLPTDADVVYVFGVGTNFNDNTIYLTEIQELHRIKLEKRTRFLPYRSELSLQLREFLEGGLGNTHETTCIFFATKRKKVANYYYKLKKRYLDEGNANIVVITADRFSFKNPDVSNVAI